MSNIKEDKSLKSFTTNYYVNEAYFLDKLGKQIDVTRLLSIALETAGQHDQLISTFLDEPLLKDNESWVITQSSVDIQRWPVLNERLNVTTRVIEVNRFFVKRHFEMRVANEVLLTVVSQYAIINLETRKMARVSVDSLENVDAVDGSIDYAFEQLRVPQGDSSVSQQDREIVARDIDYNQHVNNEVYIRWAYEMLPESYFTQFKVKKIEVKYGSELRYDEAAEVVAYLPDASIIKEGLGGGSVFQTYQTIKNKIKQKDACYIRITWQD
ncbi:acyl-[acyl-carrier-protein] thioesterase [Fundicoccus sp. Sow4_D5]|uniref:acyl-[acyl-carrier-protein] thioesterase n=1 Tax=unclassified Fundicoccus TaxID=2761543 RepID=UPI003F905A94